MLKTQRIGPFVVTCHLPNGMPEQSNDILVQNFNLNPQCSSVSLSHLEVTNSDEPNRSVNSDCIHIFYTNCDSLPSKMNELISIIDSRNPEIVALCEIKPKNSEALKQEQILLDGYNPPLNNLDDKGRGIAVYIRQDIIARPFHAPILDCFQESVWLKIHHGNKSTPTTIGCIYRSPNCTEVNTMALSRIVDSLGTLKTDVVLVGDFNFPTINWSDENAIGTRRIDRAFQIAVNDNFLTQTVNRPTRFRDGQTPALDDLVITNREELIKNIEYLPPLGKSDHICMDIKIAVGKNTSNNSQVTKDTKLMYHRGDYTCMRSKVMQVEWVNELKNKSAEASWQFFKDIIIRETTACVPTSAPGKGRRIKKSHYTNKETRDQIREKNRCWKAYLGVRSGERWHTYTKARNKLRQLTRQQKAEFETKVADESKTNPKAFWSYVKSRTTPKERIADIINKNGEFCSSDTEKANILNQQFASVFTQEPVLQDLPETTQHPDLLQAMQYLQIDEKDVLKRLQYLDVNKSAGPDQIHGRVLKELASVVAAPLTEIYQKTLNEGTVPSDWKKAIVSPIYKKKGNKQEPVNYRPISLTSIACKILEGIIREHILTYLKDTSQLAPEQHGFLPGKSCTTNLIETMDYVTEQMDDKKPVDIIYIDFSKAFDKVPHRRLLVKLESLGFNDQLLKWIKSFLTGRTMSVKINQSLSDELDVSSGIPQGSVLGPVLFVTYVNDLPRNISVPSNMLADDLKLIHSVKHVEDNIRIQGGIDQVATWCVTWLLEPNASKCSALHLGKTNRKHQYTININGKVLPLPNTAMERDLGVLIDEDLNFKAHVKEASTKANKILWTIKRAITSRSEDIIRKLYCALVRPHLEYCNQAVILKNKAEQESLERIQRRATKLINTENTHTYEERLHNIKLHSLKYRRDRGDLIQVYKYLNGYNKGNINHLLPVARKSITRGHQHKLIKNRCKTKVRQCSFSQRVVTPWNSLPAKVVGAKSIDAFKNALDKFNKDIIYLH